MFVSAPNDLRARLARGHVSDELAIAAVVIDVAFLWQGGRSVELPSSPPSAPSDPPDTSGRPAWRGTSVTAVGTVLGPVRPPFVTQVSLSVGDARRAVLVHGDRIWRRARGELSPSVAAPFDAIPMSFDYAFGGHYDVPPGLHGGLPHPGGRISYELNPHGRGFYPDPSSAAEKPLPNIERLEDAVHRWEDRPVPAGFSPCPTLAALRLRTMDTRSDALDVALRGFHHAPGDLIFPAVKPATDIRLRGLGTATVHFVVPPSPATVLVSYSRRAEETSERVRQVHIDADRSIVRVTYGHAFRYSTRAAPGRISVRRKGT